MGQDLGSDPVGLDSNESEVLQRRDFGVAIAADWSSVPAPYQKIISKAHECGYRATVLTSDGVIGIYHEQHLQLRVHLGNERLVPGAWEEPVAKLFAQVRLLHELLPENLNHGESKKAAPERVSCAIRTIFGLPEHMPLECAIHHFPGATQCLISLRKQLLASIVFNPLHKFLLEFRIDLRPLLYHLDSSTHVVKAPEQHPLGAEVADAVPGILQLARNTRIRSIIIVDEPQSFGSELRRTVLRLLPHLADLSFSELLLDIAKDQEDELARAIDQGNAVSYFLAQRTRADYCALSPEWTVLLTLARSLQLRLWGGARLAASSPLLQIFDDPHCTKRLLLYLPHSQLALAHVWLELLQRRTGRGSVAYITPLSRERFSEQSSLAADKITRPILLPLRAAIGASDDTRAVLSSSPLSDDTYVFVSSHSNIKTTIIN